MTIDALPLLRAPEAWPIPLVAALSMAALAGIDLVGAVAAKEWVRGGSLPALLVGAGAFLVLFWVYASSLQYADLATVTFGWIVALQVGLLLVDRFRYGVELPASQWVAVAVLLGAQAYLLLGPQGTA